MSNFGPELIQLLEESAHNFSSKVRNEIVKALILLRGKDMVEAKLLYESFFKLFRIKDKKIRETVHKFIVQDVKKINLKTKNHAVNKSLQNFMYTMLQDQDVTGEFLYFHMSSSKNYLLKHHIKVYALPKISTRKIFGMMKKQ